jgi:regulatory protein
MRITRLTRQRRRERVRIYVDGEEQPRLELALDLVTRAGLAVGVVLDASRAAALEAEDEVYRAREAGLRLLGHRSRSRAELRRRLQRREFSEAVIDGTLDWLADRGYLDDRAYAETFIRDRLRFRPRGRQALRLELRRNGVAAETAEAALEAVLAAEAVDESELAADVARAWGRRNGSLVARAVRSPEDRRRARRRLYGHLARRGFQGAAIAPAIAAVLGD